MKEVDSAPTGQAATTAISSRPGRKSHEQSSQQEQGTANEGGALRTPSSSWQNAHWRPLGDILKAVRSGGQSSRTSHSFWFLGSLTEICRRKYPLHPHKYHKMAKGSCSMLCAVTIYAIGITIAFLVSLTACVLTSNTCQEISNRKCI